MPHLTGIHHLALTVSDLATSAAFYERVLGAPPTGALDGEGLHRTVFTLPGGTNLGLTQHDDRAAEAFSPFRAGMDHLGLAVESRTELERWVGHLDREGIDHSGIVEAPYGAALSFTDPDGIALELFVSS